MFLSGLMVGYQHQVGSRTAKMLMLPSLPFQAAPKKQEHFTHSNSSTHNESIKVMINIYTKVGLHVLHWPHVRLSTSDQVGLHILRMPTTMVQRMTKQQ